MPKPANKTKPSPVPSKSWKTYCSPAVLLIVVVALTAIVDCYWRDKRQAFGPLDPTRTQGAPSARLKMVEFVDFQHRDCALGHAILKEYFARHPKDISLTVKYFSLANLNSTPGMLYAHCAAQQNRFFGYQDALFALQPQWNNAPDADKYLMAYAQKLGLDLRKVKACTEDDNTKAVVFRETALGAEHLVKTVPTYFINDEMIVGSEGLRRYFEAHLP